MKRAETQADLRPNATDGANVMGKANKIIEANTINEDKPTNADADGHATKEPNPASQATMMRRSSRTRAENILTTSHRTKSSTQSSSVWPKRLSPRYGPRESP